MVEPGIKRPKSESGAGILRNLLDNAFDNQGQLETIRQKRHKLLNLRIDRLLSYGRGVYGHTFTNRYMTTVPGYQSNSDDGRAVLQYLRTRSIYTANE